MKEIESKSSNIATKSNHKGTITSNIIDNKGHKTITKVTRSKIQPRTYPIAIRRDDYLQITSVTSPQIALNCTGISCPSGIKPRKHQKGVT